VVHARKEEEAQCVTNGHPRCTPFYLLTFVMSSIILCWLVSWDSTAFLTEIRSCCACIILCNQFTDYMQLMMMMMMMMIMMIRMMSVYTLAPGCWVSRSVTSQNTAWTSTFTLTFTFTMNAFLITLLACHRTVQSGNSSSGQNSLLVHLPDSTCTVTEGQTNIQR